MRTAHRESANTAAVEPRNRFGSTEGNELLTSAVGVLLACLLIAEGVTIVDIGGLAGAHMFIGLVLIPPVVLKLASTGYRALRYYIGTPSFRASGPPRLPLRLMAPIFVGLTATVFVTGVLLLVDGDKAGMLLEIHKVSFILWGVLFAVHSLAYVSHAVRLSLRDWHLGRRLTDVPGVGARAIVIVASLGGGTALAVALLSTIDHWHP